MVLEIKTPPSTITNASSSFTSSYHHHHLDDHQPTPPPVVDSGSETAPPQQQQGCCPPSRCLMFLGFSFSRFLGLISSDPSFSLSPSLSISLSHESDTHTFGVCVSPFYFFQTDVHRRKEIKNGFCVLILTKSNLLISNFSFNTLQPWCLS